MVYGVSKVLTKQLLPQTFFCALFFQVYFSFATQLPVESACLLTKQGMLDNPSPTFAMVPLALPSICQFPKAAYHCASVLLHQGEMLLPNATQSPPNLLHIPNLFLIPILV